MKSSNIDNLDDLQKRAFSRFVQGIVGAVFVAGIAVVLAWQARPIESSTQIWLIVSSLFLTAVILTAIALDNRGHQDDLLLRRDEQDEVDELLANLDEQATGSNAAVSAPDSNDPVGVHPK